MNADKNRAFEMQIADVVLIIDRRLSAFIGG